jgi:putative redox protein
MGNNIPEGKNTVKIHLTRLNDAVHFQAITSDSVIHLDGSADIGGQAHGPRPTEMLLAALGGCAGIDVVYVLRKKRQTITSFDITVSATREKGKVPSLFETIHVEFILDGDIKPAAALRAAQLSLEKYCTVAKILEKSAVITHSVRLNSELL